MTVKPPLVLDCNVILQAAARAKSAAAKCLNLAEDGVVQLCLSREVFAEVEGVLSRPEVRALPDLSDEIVGAFLKRLKNLSVFVRHVPKEFSYPRDKDDEPYINLAVAAGADFIAGRDKDPPDLMTGHTDECKEFRRRLRPLRAVEPDELLKTVEGRETIRY